MKHIDQIKKALKIEGIHSVNSSWKTDGAQVDLIIRRSDNWINLCEMKFHSSPFKIGKNQVNDLRNKVALFREDTGTRDAVVITMISTFGVVENEHANEVIENDFKMDILFEKE